VSADAVADKKSPAAGRPRLGFGSADRALSNPFQALSGLLGRPMASYYLILGSAGLLLAIGLLMVLSASSIDSIEHVDGSIVLSSAFALFAKQLMYALAGIPAFVVGLRVPVHWHRVIGYPLLVLSALLLLVLAVAPSSSMSTSAYGSTRWIDIGPVVFQPSEPAKLALALWGADVLVRKRALLGEWRHLLIPLFPVSVGLLALVGQADLGTMLCLLLVLLSLLWVAGVRLRVFAVMFAAAIAGVLGLIAVEPYRIQRLLGFQDPFADPTGSGHQAVQGLYALAGGGWWGVGLGASRAKWGYLPNSHNDFIFAIIGEELGLIGCFVVLALFCVFTYAGLRIARRVDDPYLRLVASACTVWLSGQAFINVAAVIGLVPITGIPLPLISAGGSSLVLTMYIIGMLASFARHEPDAARVLHARGRTWLTVLVGLPRPARPVPSRTPARPRTGTPSSGTPTRGGTSRTGTPRTGTPRTGTPRTGTPSSGTRTRPDRSGARR
jgi:cell division protein FtsW